MVYRGMFFDNRMLTPPSNIPWQYTYRMLHKSQILIRLSRRLVIYQSPLNVQQFALVTNDKFGFFV